MNGRINMYTGEGQFTDDPIPSEFFGCAGVSSRLVAEPVADALGYYLGFDICIPQKK